MKNINAPCCVLSVVAFGTVMSSPLLSAQENPRGHVIEEVVVTAEKRASTVQDTSISISAVTGDTLRDRGVSDLMDLSGYLPNFQMNKSGDSLLINIRGINSSDTTEDSEPAAAFHLDGVYIGRPIATGQVFFDVDRVEVLRGPQGTLYGRNATAGSINLITNKPGEEFEAGLHLGVGNYDLITSEGMINLPVSDSLSLRAAFSTEDHDGYLNTSNPSAGISNDTGDVESRAARIKAMYTPTDELSLLFSYDYATQGGKGPGSVVLRLGEPSRDNPFNTPGSRDYVFWGISAEVNYDLDWATLTYLGAKRVNDTKSSGDGDDSSDYSVILTRDSGVETRSHELRMTSNSNGSLEWLAGLYYFEEDSETETRFIDFPTPFPFGPPLIEAVFENPLLVKTSYAAFGQLTYHFTEEVSLIGGLRYTEDELENEGLTSFIPLFTSSKSIDEEWDSTDWKLGLDWRVMDDSLVYLTVGTGYKAGGVADSVDFDPEDVLAYEVGSKNRLMDGRLQLNMAAFHYDYTDYQATYLGITQNGTPGAVTDNAGKAEIKGVELESNFLVNDNGRVDVSVSYLDAEFTDYMIITPIGPVDNSGNSLNSAPEWTVNLSYQHSWGLDSGAEVLARASVYWQDEYVLTANQPPPEAFRDSFTRSSIALTYNSANDAWYVQAFAKNIEGKNVANSYQVGAITGQSTKTNLEAPKTYGLRFGLNWQ